ncbi:predicted protein [Plenodomus lingam JN3]|uniref:Predicted protein n=1 Tax=Leptosphaeria maculans (strain JN3 / isolate v23.1.3 / race Av1-4-5-6-7-8) TaxID=985895 RepID=E5A076_LEPMJ|nr:predicted protein [Plenodomus lingam JN3]CBX96936.1 predicted protein [Plenodomus lingam JN3]
MGNQGIDPTRGLESLSTCGWGMLPRRGGMSYDHGFSVGRLGLYSKWLEYPCRFKSTLQRQIFIVI